MPKTMTSMERVIKSINHQEPDQVPLFLLLSMYGAKEVGMTIKEYFSKSQNVVEAQIRMRKKYSNDCYYTFSYAAAEIEAWGGEVVFFEDGPPNAGEPIIKKGTRIDSLVLPNVEECKCLLSVLHTIESLKKYAGDTVPIIGVVMSPASLAVMQMGFQYFLDMLLENPTSLHRLLKMNQSFCIQWANAQLASGASAICYFDPVSSPTVIPKDRYINQIHEISKTTIAQIKGPTAIHMASGVSIPIIEELIETKTNIIGISSKENVGEIKGICQNRVAIMGNLNGIEMCHWSTSDTEKAVKDIIRAVASGGGFILSDQHGEIPLQVKEDTLLAIGETVKQWGRYPIK